MHFEGQRSLKVGQIQKSYGFPGGLVGKESTCSVDSALGSVPGLGRCPGGGHSNPL